ncbi:MAG TPA: flagellar export protein FliJ [Syntrophales bacterium]|nr:flagellar export protein FliJ [Syntrophales bacterium]HRS86587.1 flagellar export protein FliJ [Syntrophales bacterium]
MFVFKLQSVLDARKAKEDQLLGEYRELARALEAEKDRLAAMGREKERMLNRLRAKHPEPQPAQELEMEVTYLKVWNAKMDTQGALVARLREEVEGKRRALMEVMKDRKILENLKERHFEEYKQLRASLERLAADESAVLRHGRKEP